MIYSPVATILHEKALLIRSGPRWLPHEALRGLTEVRVQQHLGMPTLCELYFRDPPGPLATAEAMALGSSLWLGLESDPHPLFSGDVTAVEHLYGPENVVQIYVRAYDRLHRLRKRQHVRVYEGVTLHGLASRMAASIDVELEMPPSDLAWERVYQHQQSDLDLLLELAALDGLYPALHDGVLHLVSMAGSGEAIPLALGENLLDAQVELNSAGAVDRVGVYGWDPARAELYEAEAREGHSGRRVRAAVDPEQVGGDGQRLLLNEYTPRQAQAQALAQAELDRHQAAEVVLRGRVRGAAALRPGVPVAISGLSRSLNGRYVLGSVTHTLNPSEGFVSTVDSAPPTIPARLRGDVATFGVVTGTGDPDGLGRVQTRLPTYGNVQSGWMPVLTPGAGSNKGFITLPDVGDTVLVLLTRENPGQGIVLGGLYAHRHPPDAGTVLAGAADMVRAGSVRRHTWVTGGGQQIQLDDVGNKIRLQNDSGAYIELAGGAITIVGESIDFRRLGLARRLGRQAEKALDAEERSRAEMAQWLKKQREQGRWLLIIAVVLVVLLFIALLVSVTLNLLA